MKRIALLCGLVFILAMCASAQTYIDFSNMHLAATPSPMPDNYPGVPNLAWDNFLYVTPGAWKAAGPGFHVDPATQHNNVAFFGGAYCPAVSCYGSIKMPVILVGPATTVPNFQPISMMLSAGWKANNLTVAAYLNSKYLGSVVWKLTTIPQIQKFPPQWTRVTQLIFTPAVANATPPEMGSVVVYNFILVKH
jgi:hypothetical protein